MKDGPFTYLIPKLYAPLAIQGISLTPRQWDVLAAFVHLKKPQSVATLLKISNKSIEAHLYNIRQKFLLKRQDLRSLLDTCSPDERVLLHKHHQYLLVEQAFQNTLGTLKSKTLTKKIVYQWMLQDNQNLAIPLAHISHHLHMAGLTLTTLDNTQNGVLHNDYAHNEPHSNEDVIRIDVSSFHQSETPQNYYKTMIQILKTVFSDQEHQRAFQDFLSQEKNILSDPKQNNAFLHMISSFFTHLLKASFYRKYKYLLLVFGLSLLMLKSVLPEKSIPPSFHPIRSNTIHRIPSEPFLLKRPDLWNKMVLHLTPSKKGPLLPCVVITGIEGTSKTTLARYYGLHSKDADLVWEFNASSYDALYSGFEDLAYKLAQTKELKEDLALIQQIQDDQRRQKSLVDFVERRVKLLKS